MQGDNKERLGKQGEAIVRQWLIGQGYQILPASLIDGIGAPMLLGKQRFILPDNLVWHDGIQGWVEVKTKSVASPHELPPKRQEHGIKLYHWVAYEMIQMHTHTPISLAILQVDIQSVGLSLIDNLRRGVRIYPMQGEYHIFFDWDDFEWHLLEGITMPEPITPTSQRTIRQIQEQGQEEVYAKQRLF
ncbi:hypothetical protein HWQ67_16765 [Candidatus Magnetobacterium casensis]|uniref:Uncharacterized protein n=1 Tax=Candidatus Magnetobacterium casense TaxID=1455061 RepID=A0ABS6S4B8_9BACT|nr:hypothetical protein [Candidatus Magnetobacterium casensis]